MKARHSRVVQLLFDFFQFLLMFLHFVLQILGTQTRELGFDLHLDEFVDLLQDASFNWSRRTS